MRFLLDTNVLSEPRLPRPSRAVLSKLATFAGRVATASPCIHELVFGAERLPQSARRREVEVFVQELIHAITVLPYDLEAAAWHARERARLARAGRTPPFVDGQIAAIAATRGLVLVTKNLRDFRVYRGLHVEDWAR
jgi:tRNA(fMet)-specific endonuclease VapC